MPILPLLDDLTLPRAGKVSTAALEVVPDRGAVAFEPATGAREVLEDEL